MYSNVHAEEQTATLRQGAQTMAFYGPDALIDAYAAAADSGDVIILSTGQFNDLGSITKPITIIGTYGFDVYPGQGSPVPASDKTTLGDITISANNVTLEGIYFSGAVILGEVSNCHVKRCHIETRLTAISYHTNTKIDQCVVKYDDAISYGINYHICNSTIGYLNTDSGYNTYVTNCFLYDLFDPSYNSSEQPYNRFTAVSFTNNVIALDLDGYHGKIVLTSDYVNNCFWLYNYGEYDEYWMIGDDDSPFDYFFGYIENNTFVETHDTSIEQIYPNTSTGWGTGLDGTPIGVMGGQGFTAYPHIPYITNATIDDHIDAEGTTHVKINVSVTP